MSREDQSAADKARELDRIGREAAYEEALESGHGLGDQYGPVDKDGKSFIQPPEHFAADPTGLHGGHLRDLHATEIIKADVRAAYDRQEERLAAERAEDARRDLVRDPAGQLRSFLQQPLNLIRLAAAGLGVIGLFLLAQSFNAAGGTPGTTVPGGASASPAAGSPVTGSTTANATFTKVSGPCRLATRFTDRFSVEAKDGALTLTQLSNGHVSRGTIDRSGAFTTSAEGQGYRGTITGTTATGQHTYTGDGCNEVYDFTMQLSGPLIAGTPVQGSGNRPPQAGPIVAVQEGTSTIYTVPDATDPEGAPLRWTWSNPHPCAPRSGSEATYVWPHPHPPCPAEPVHPAIVRVTISDGRLAVIREYSGGSAAGTGTVPPTPASTASSTPTATAGPTATAAPSTGGGFSFPLFALGLVFLIGAFGVFFGGPRLIGGPVIAQQKDEEKDPCAEEKAREAAARARRDAANARFERIDGLNAERQRTQQAAERAAAAEAAAKQGAAYGEVDGRRVYVNRQKAAEIAAAEQAAAQARAAADAARSAFEAAGGENELWNANDERFKANRDWQEAYDALQRCLQLFAPPPPPPTSGGSGGGATTGGTGTGIGTGTGTGDGTRTRTRGCTEGEIRNETTSEHRFFVHDLGNAQIEVEGTRLITDDSHARGFLDHLETIDDTFKKAKIGSGLAQGEVVGPALDAIDFPDFLTYFGEVRERLDETMRRFLEQMRQYRRQGEYTIKYTTHHFKIVCRKWEECDGEQFVAKSETTMTLERSANGQRGPEMLTDERSRARWLDGWIGANGSLRRHNERAEREAEEFRQGCR